MRRNCPTLCAKKNPESSTPASTPWARSWVATTTATVAIITALELFGVLRRLRNDAQLKVPIDTMIITATSAAMGICFTQSPRNTTRMSKTAPATAWTAARGRPTSR